MNQIEVVGSVSLRVFGQAITRFGIGRCCRHMEFGSVIDTEASGTWKLRREPATKTVAATVADLRCPPFSASKRQRSALSAKS